MTDTPTATISDPPWTLDQLGLTGDNPDEAADPRHPDRCNLPHQPGDMTCGGPWTRHGHPIPGITIEGRGRPGIARCGGPAICPDCARDAEQIRASGVYRRSAPIDPVPADRCPTCQGPNRHTIDMVCMDCGRDYMPDDGTDETVPGLGWKRLMGLWRDQVKAAAAERDTLALTGATHPAPMPSAITAACPRCAQTLNADLVIPFGAEQDAKLLKFTATYSTPHVCLDLLEQVSTFEQIPAQHARAVAALAALDEAESTP